MLTRNCPALSDGSALGEHLLKDIPRDVLDRCDAIVPFRALEPGDARAIVRKGLEELHRTLKPCGIGLRAQDKICDLIVMQGYSPQKGAVDLPAVFEALVAKPASDLVEAGKVQRGSALDIAEQDGHVVVRVAN